MQVQWNPWHGCHKCSPGCLNCYVYYLDKKRDKDPSVVKKAKTNFNLPLKKDKFGEYKIKSGTLLATCFTSDFFIEEADPWREEIWQIIKFRSDVQFLIPTKRIERFQKCIPKDWGDGYENVTIAVTCENQEKVEERLPLFLDYKIKHRVVFASPLLENLALEKYLGSKKIEMVSVSGESYERARICDFSWVRHIKEECDKYNIKFDFHQTGSNFLMNGKKYRIRHFDEYAQAKKGMQLLEKEKII